MAVTGARLAWCAETDRYAAAVLAAPLARRAQPRRRHRPGLGGGAARRPGHRRVAVPGHLLRRPGRRHHGRNPQWPVAAHRRRPSPPSTQLRLPGERRRAPHARPRRKSSATWPRSGMTRNGSAFALPTPEPRTAATACSSSPSGPAQPQGSRLLPTPVAGNFNDGESLPTWQARRDRQKKLGRNGNGIGTPLPIAIALLPTPMAGDFGADKAAGPVTPLGGQTADRPARRDHPPPRRPGRPGRDSGTRRGPAAADPGHRLLAERPRPAGRPARQRAPERPGPRRRGHRPHRAGAAGRREPGRVGGVRAGDPPLGARPRVPRAAARRAGAVRPAPAVGRVRRVDDGPRPSASSSLAASSCSTARWAR